MNPIAIRIFYGQANDTLADVYVEIDVEGDFSKTVGGEFKGPYCSLRTDPALRDSFTCSSAPPPVEGAGCRSLFLVARSSGRLSVETDAR